MKDGARLQAVIDVLELFQRQKTTPFDRILHTYLKERRYIGSKDRQEISEKSFAILRRWFAYEKSLSPYATPRLMAFYHAKKNIPEPCPHSPEPLTPQEKTVLKNAKHVYYDFLPDDLMALFSDPGIIPSLQDAAFVDLRVNTLKITREMALKELGEGEVTPYSPFGIRLKKRTPLNNHPLWRDGFVDIQDEGSQIASIMCEAKPYHTVLDLCAGAGGKTLALASMMQNKGVIIATDIANWRLERAKERIKKSGIHNTQIRNADEKWFLRQQHRFDRVVVDAPCSGSGTWRRNPDLKIRTTPQTVDDIVLLQQEILKKAAPLVKKGGRLIYITCSVFEAENDSQIKWFLELFPNFHVVSAKEVWERNFATSYGGVDDQCLHLNPMTHGTDGFFVAVLEDKMKIS